MKKAVWALLGPSLLTAIGLNFASSNFSSANAASIGYLASPFDGDRAEVKITLDDSIQLGKVQFKVDVVPNPFIADIRGVFFNILNDSLLKSLEITGSDITEFVKRPGDVASTTTSSVLPEGKFDLGVQIGTPGRVKDDIRSTIFTLSHPDVALDISHFTTQTDPVTSKGPKQLLFGVDVTSVGTVNGPRSGRSRLGAGLDDKITTVAVPEPGMELGLGLFAVGSLVMFRKKKKQVVKV